MDKFFVLMAVGFVVAFFLVAIVFVNRRRLFFWLLGHGTSTTAVLLRSVLRMVGEDQPQWVLVSRPGLGGQIGLVLKKQREKAAVFLPSVPSLIPGELIFVPRKAFRPLHGLTLEEGITTLLLVHGEKTADALGKILRQMELEDDFTSDLPNQT